MGNSGIKAEGVRPVALLRKDNYKAWSTKLKAQLRVMDCWRLVTATELQPPATGAPGCTAAETAAAELLRRNWDRRKDRASAVLITSITDDELHTVQAVDEDPVAIWTRLRENFERRSEAQAETAHMKFLDFTHLESETANETIERFETLVTTCLDQGIVIDENMKKRMLIGRPAERYQFLKQNYLLAPVATKPDLPALKAQIRDIDSEFQKVNAGSKNKAGQANRAEEANWSQGSTSGGSKQYDKSGGKYFGRGGRGSGNARNIGGRGSGSGCSNVDRRDKDNSGAGGGDVTCYCCGQKGHIKPNCPKKDDESCRKCGRIRHLQSMCKSTDKGGSGGSEGPRIRPEAGQFDDFESFTCEATIGAMEAMVGEQGFVGKSEQQLDTWLGDSGASYHIKSSSAGMIDVTKCPPGTKIKQV